MFSSAGQAITHHPGQQLQQQHAQHQHHHHHQHQPSGEHSSDRRHHRQHLHLQTPPPPPQVALTLQLPLPVTPPPALDPTTATTTTTTTAAAAGAGAGAGASSPVSSTGSAASSASGAAWLAPHATASSTSASIAASFNNNHLSALAPSSVQRVTSGGSGSSSISASASATAATSIGDLAGSGRQAFSAALSLGQPSPLQQQQQQQQHPPSPSPSPWIVAEVSPPTTASILSVAVLSPAPAPSPSRASAASAASRDAASSSATTTTATMAPRTSSAAARADARVPPRLVLRRARGGARPTPPPVPALVPAAVAAAAAAAPSSSKLGLGQGPMPSPDGSSLASSAEFSPRPAVLVPNPRPSPPLTSASASAARVQAALAAAARAAAAADNLRWTFDSPRAALDSPAAGSQDAPSWSAPSAARTPIANAAAAAAHRRRRRSSTAGMLLSPPSTPTTAPVPAPVPVPVPATHLVAPPTHAQRAAAAKWTSSHNHPASDSDASSSGDENASYSDGSSSAASDSSSTSAGDNHSQPDAPGNRSRSASTGSNGSTPLRMGRALRVRLVDRRRSSGAGSHGNASDSNRSIRSVSSANTPRMQRARLLQKATKQLDQRKLSAPTARPSARLRAWGRRRVEARARAARSAERDTPTPSSAPTPTPPKAHGYGFAASPSPAPQAVDEAPPQQQQQQQAPAAAAGFRLPAAPPGRGRHSLAAAAAAKPSPSPGLAQPASSPPPQQQQQFGSVAQPHGRYDSPPSTRHKDDHTRQSPPVLQQAPAVELVAPPQLPGRGGANAFVGSAPPPRRHGRRRGGGGKGNGGGSAAGSSSSSSSSSSGNGASGRATGGWQRGASSGRAGGIGGGGGGGGHDDGDDDDPRRPWRRGDIAAPFGNCMSSGSSASTSASGSNGGSGGGATPRKQAAAGGLSQSARHYEVQDSATGGKAAAAERTTSPTTTIMSPTAPNPANGGGANRPAVAPTASGAPHTPGAGAGAGAGAGGSNPRSAGRPPRPVYQHSGSTEVETMQDLARVAHQHRLQRRQSQEVDPLKDREFGGQLATLGGADPDVLKIAHYRRSDDDMVVSSVSRANSQAYGGVLMGAAPDSEMGSPFAGNHLRHNFPQVHLPGSRKSPLAADGSPLGQGAGGGGDGGTPSSGGLHSALNTDITASNRQARGGVVLESLGRPAAPAGGLAGKLGIKLEPMSFGGPAVLTPAPAPAPAPLLQTPGLGGGFGGGADGAGKDDGESTGDSLAWRLGLNLRLGPEVTQGGGGGGGPRVAVARDVVDDEVIDDDTGREEQIARAAAAAASQRALGGGGGGAGGGAGVGGGDMGMGEPIVAAAPAPGLAPLVMTGAYASRDAGDSGGGLGLLGAGGPQIGSGLSGMGLGTGLGLDLAAIDADHANPAPDNGESEAMFGEADEEDGRLTATGTFEVGDIRIKESGLANPGRAARAAAFRRKGAAGGAGGGGGSGSDSGSSNMKDNLVKISVLGQGASGKVYKAVHIGRLKLVAVKVIPVFESDKRHQITKELKALCKNLQPLQGTDGSGGVPCPYVVSFYDAFINPTEGNVSLVMEYMDGGSLQDIVDTGGCSSESVLANISYRLLCGLDFIHSLRQIHRDIKPSNLLINHMGDVKISDFGIVKELGTQRSMANTFVGTLTYMSPERISGEDYTYTSDVWSLGLSIMSCALARYPLDTKGGYWGLLHLLRESEVPRLPSPPFSKLAADFIGLMLIKDPRKRPEASELLKHKFLAKCAKTVAAHRQAAASKANTSQADSDTAHDELKDIVLHVMDYRYRAVRKRLKQLKEKGEPMTTSKWRKAATLPRIQHSKVKALAHQLGLPVEVVRHRFEVKQRQVNDLLRKKTLGSLASRYVEDSDVPSSGGAAGDQVAAPS